MQIHRIRGRDLKDALERAGERFGTQALVLSHENMPDGGVLVAVADPDRAVAARIFRAVKPSERDPGLDDVERVMARSGCSAGLIEATLAQVRRSGAHGPYALDAAAELLGGKVRVAPSPRVRRQGGESLSPPCAVAFVGPTGVGKTTTLAKLAARLVRAGRRVGIVTTDTQRPGAALQLAALAASIHAPVENARSGAELARAVASFATCECVLIDTSGRSPHDTAALSELSRSLETAGGSLEVYLTVAATASRNALAETAAGFSTVRPGAWVVTKIDETHEPAGVLELAAESDAAVAFLCDGQELSGHFHRADPERFADLFLRGKLE